MDWLDLRISFDVFTAQESIFDISGKYSPLWTPTPRHWKKSGEVNFCRSLHISLSFLPFAVMHSSELWDICLIFSAGLSRGLVRLLLIEAIARVIKNELNLAFRNKVRDANLPLEVFNVISPHLMPLLIPLFLFLFLFLFFFLSFSLSLFLSFSLSLFLSFSLFLSLSLSFSPTHRCPIAS